MAFTFEEITEKVKGAKGRPPIVALEFRLKKFNLIKSLLILKFRDNSKDNR